MKVTIENPRSIAGCSLYKWGVPMNGARRISCISLAMFALSLSAGRWAFADSNAPAGVDAAVVGTWRFVQHTSSGNVVAYWIIQPDGHYREKLTGPGSGPDETGKVQFQHGVWAMQRDPGGGGSGAYTIYDHSILSLVTTDTTLIWFRASDTSVAASSSSQDQNANSKQAVEQDLVGTWRLLRQTNNGPEIVTRTVKADGHYETVYQGVNHDPHETGQLNFNDGDWSLHSDSGLSDKGNYEFRDRDTIEITGASTTEVWLRAYPAANPPK